MLKDYENSPTTGEFGDIVMTAEAQEKLGQMSLMAVASLERATSPESQYSQSAEVKM